MNPGPGHLFSREEVERACLLVEKCFGTAYFKRGIELLKDSDPAGPGMGRNPGRKNVSRLLLSWYRSREELAFAELEGFFAPGVHSAMIGVLGRSLETLAGVPGVKEAAAGLLDDAAFDLTLFLLAVAAGFRSAGGDLNFPCGPVGCFFIGRRHAAICLRAGINRSLWIPDLRQAVPGRPSRLQHLLAGRRHLFYIDLSGTSAPLEDTAGILESAPDTLTGPGDPPPEAVVLCKTQFLPGTWGVRWKISGLPVFRKKTSVPTLDGGINIYLP